MTMLSRVAASNWPTSPAVSCLSQFQRIRCREMLKMCVTFQFSRYKVDYIPHKMRRFKKLSVIAITKQSDFGRCTYDKREMRYSCLPQEKILKRQQRYYVASEIKKKKIFHPTVLLYRAINILLLFPFSHFYLNGTRMPILKIVELILLHRFSTFPINNISVFYFIPEILITI